MVRGFDVPHREICAAFSPNPFATVRLPDAVEAHELCYECEHLEVCHGRGLTETLLDIAEGGDTPEVRKAVRSAVYDAFVPPDLRHRFED